MPSGGTRTDDGVQFVNEQNDILGAADFIHDGFDAFFKLAAIFCSGDHQGEVEGDDAFVAENLGDVAFGNFLGETFDDGSFPDAGFTEQHGIVLGAAAKNLDDAFDFVGAANHGIHFTFAGDFGQVASESF